jgi:hypothetical protein
VDVSACSFHISDQADQIAARMLQNANA